MKRILIFLVILIAGCSLRPLSTPQINTYQLQSIGQKPAAKTYGHYTLLVTMPSASTSYQSRNMWYSIHRYQLQSFARNQWVAPPSEMLLPLIVASLRNTQHFHAVVAPPFPGLADFQLNTKITQFQQVFSDDGSYFNFSLLATVINNKNNRVVAQRRFQAIIHTPEDTPYGGVIAANQATAQILRQLSAWCVHTIF